MDIVNTFHCYISQLLALLPEESSDFSHLHNIRRTVFYEKAYFTENIYRIMEKNSFLSTKVEMAIDSFIPAYIMIVLVINWYRDNKTAQMSSKWFHVKCLNNWMPLFWKISSINSAFLEKTAAERRKREKKIKHKKKNNVNEQRQV